MSSRFQRPSSKDTRSSQLPPARLVEEGPFVTASKMRGIVMKRSHNRSLGWWRPLPILGGCASAEPYAMSPFLPYTADRMRRGRPDRTCFAMGHPRRQALVRSSGGVAGGVIGHHRRRARQRGSDHRRCGGRCARRQPHRTCECARPVSRDRAAGRWRASRGHRGRRRTVARR